MLLSQNAKSYSLLDIAAFLNAFSSSSTLGQPREANLAQAHDAGLLERIGLAWLAVACVVLGVLPVQVIGQLEAVSGQLLATQLGQQSAQWWLLAPAPARGASYGPLVFLLAGGILTGLTVLGVRAFYHQRVRRGPAWDCGFVRLDARMQETAKGFGQPIRHIFQPFFRMSRELPTPFDVAPRYRVTVTDRIWQAGYERVGRSVRRVADVVARLQQGRISTYLLYSFITLIVLLWIVV